MNPTERALLDAVLATPEDDLPRLVYADWLEENGNPERAAFIRVQCSDAAAGQYTSDAKSVRFYRPYAGIGADWPNVTVSIRRGFVWYVGSTLSDWCGGECPYCENGTVYEYADGYTVPGSAGACEMCHGTGRTFGIGPAVVRSHPVTYTVLTDVVRRSGAPGSGFGRVTPDSAGVLFPFAFPNAYGSHIEGHFGELVRVMSDAAIRWAKSQPHPAPTA